MANESKNKNQALERNERSRDREALGQRGFAPSRSFDSPFGLMRRFSEEMDRMFGDFGFGRGEMAPSGTQQFWTPRVEVSHEGGEFAVRAELPGLKKDDVQVEVANGVLTIQGERRHEHEERRGGRYHSERSYGHFYRAIPLPEGSLAETAKASFRDGLLEIKIQCPPDEVSRSHRVEIAEGR